MRGAPAVLVLAAVAAVLLLMREDRPRAPAADTTRAPSPRAARTSDANAEPAQLRGASPPSAAQPASEPATPVAPAARAAPPEPEAPPGDRPLAPEAVADRIRPASRTPLTIARDDLLGPVRPYGVLASSAARAPSWDGVARIAVDPAAGSASPLPSTAVIGTVLREDGVPLAGAEVILYSSCYLRRARYDHRVVEIGRSFTDSEGRFDLRPISVDTVHFGAGGEILATIRHPHVADLVAQRLPRIEAGRESDVGVLVLPDESAVIEGVVRDLAGQPVAGAVVRASGVMNPVRYDKTDRMVVLKDCPRAVTDAAGRYRLENFARGLHDVSVHVNIDCVVHTSRRWEGTSTWSPRVRAGNAIHGRVVDPDGNPVEAAVIVGGGNWTPSNADGTFWLDNIDPGPLVLEISHHAWRRVRVPNVPTNGDDVRIELEAHLPRVELEVHDGGGAPLTLIAIAWSWAPGTGPTTFTPQSPHWHDARGCYTVIVPEGAQGAQISDTAGHAVSLEAEDLCDGARLSLVIPEPLPEER